MDAIECMLLKIPVTYNGGSYHITSTFDDGTVEIEDEFGNSQSVNEKEVEACK